MKYLIRVNGLTMSYGSDIICENVSFSVEQGRIFVIMGASGSGKSTLFKHMIGLKRPSLGNIFYYERDFFELTDEEQSKCLRKIGVLFQNSALWTSMTIEENIVLPLKQYTNLDNEEISEIVNLKLKLVGLSGSNDLYPSQLSGGMRKRASLARAIALDPSIVFFDEPSAGLDPIHSKYLDELILKLRDAFGTTFVVITHDLRSIHRITDECIFLDEETRGIIGQGTPKDLMKNSKFQKIRTFLTY